MLSSSPRTGAGEGAEDAEPEDGARASGIGGRRGGGFPGREAGEACRVLSSFPWKRRGRRDEKEGSAQAGRRLRRTDDAEAGGARARGQALSSPGEEGGTGGGARSHHGRRRARLPAGPFPGWRLRVRPAACRPVRQPQPTPASAPAGAAGAACRCSFPAQVHACLGPAHGQTGAGSRRRMLLVAAAPLPPAARTRYGGLALQGAGPPAYRYRRRRVP